MKTEYKLNILGRELKILSDCSPDHMKTIETLLVERITALGGAPTSGVPQVNAVVLAAMNIADELVRERESHRALKEKIRSRSAVLLEKLEQKNFAA